MVSITYLSDPRLRRHSGPVLRRTLVMGCPTQLVLSIGLLYEVPIPAGVQIGSAALVMIRGSHG